MNATPEVWTFVQEPPDPVIVSPDVLPILIQAANDPTGTHREKEQVGTWHWPEDAPA